MGFDEPLDNIGRNATCKPDPKLAKKKPSWFIGKFAKIAFAFTADGEEYLEWMWVKVKTASAEQCNGELNNDPIYVVGLKDGDPVSFRPDRVTEVLEV